MKEMRSPAHHAHDFDAAGVYAGESPLMPTVIPILPVAGQTPAVAFETGTTLTAAALSTFAVTGPMMVG